jgi:hypothetical protein
MDQVHAKGGISEFVEPTAQGAGGGRSARRVAREMGVSRRRARALAGRGRHDEVNTSLQRRSQLRRSAGRVFHETFALQCSRTFGASIVTADRVSE